jgi:ribose transport system substrate-binding protein
MSLNLKGSMYLRFGSITAASTLILAGLVSSAGSPASAAGKTYKVAVLLASANNGYNQAVATGVKQEASKLGVKVKLTMLGADFNTTTQLSQLENATSNNLYNGVVIVPNDGTALGAAFPTADGAPVVTVLDPIGPKWNDMIPQVKNVVSTVAVPVSSAAKRQTVGLISYCAKINPCNVVVIVGNTSSSLDNARDVAYKAAFASHSNIHIVATLNGAYDPATSSAAMTNALVANPHINAVMSNADQQTQGVEIALKAAGIKPSSVYLTGGGGTTYAVAAVRNGTWKSDYVNFPVTMGKNALKQLVNKLTGKIVTKWVNADIGPTTAYATKATLAKTPSFRGEWAG